MFAHSMCVCKYSIRKYKLVGYKLGQRRFDSWLLKQIFKYISLRNSFIKYFITIEGTRFHIYSM